MIDQKKHSTEWKTSEEVLHINDLKSAMAYFESTLEHLQQKFKVLPNVEKDGSSKCLFAEDLYADKEEAVLKVTDRLRKIRDYLPLIDREIARCTKNLNIIDSDQQKLQDENAREQYQSALHAQQYLHQKAIDQKKLLLELIEHAEQMLKQANTKKYPGKKPKKRFRPLQDVFGPLIPPAPRMPLPPPPVPLDILSPPTKITPMPSLLDTSVPPSPPAIVTPIPSPLDTSGPPNSPATTRPIPGPLDAFVPPNPPAAVMQKFSPLDAFDLPSPPGTVPIPSPTDAFDPASPSAAVTSISTPLEAFGPTSPPATPTPIPSPLDASDLTSPPVTITPIHTTMPTPSPQPGPAGGELGNLLAMGPLTGNLVP